MKATIKVKQKTNQAGLFSKINFGTSLIIVLFTLLVSTSSFAKTSLSESNSKERITAEIRKQLNEQIKFPEFFKTNNTNNESVNVLFQVKSDGTVKVVKTDGPNENLNAFIEQQFKKARIVSVQGSEEELYKINIHFKLL